MKWLHCSTVLLLAVVSLLIPCNGYADAIAVSSINFSNLRIRPALGSVVFGGPWSAQGFAQAQNTLGEGVAQFDFSAGGLATANAAVTFASAMGSADGGALTGFASSNVNLTGLTTPVQGISAGQGALFNTFMLTGGAGSTTVDFAVLAAGLLRLITDASAIQATTQTSFTLQLDGNPVLFFSSSLAGGANFNSTTP